MTAASSLNNGSSYYSGKYCADSDSYIHIKMKKVVAKKKGDESQTYSSTTNSSEGNKMVEEDKLCCVVEDEEYNPKKPFSGVLNQEKSY
jgi:hypothetical protein